MFFLLFITSKGVKCVFNIFNYKVNVNQEGRGKKGTLRKDCE